MAELPTTPGAYLDKAGDIWMLTNKGSWVDCEGNAPAVLGEAEKTALKTVLPMTPFPRGVEHETVYRVVNEGEHYESIEFGLLEEARLEADHTGDVVQTRLSMEPKWEVVPGEQDETVNEGSGSDLPEE